MNHGFVRVVALAGILGLAACGDDPTSVGDPLTDAEVAELAFVLLGGALETGMDGGSFIPAAGAGPSAAPISFQGSVDDTHACPLGGTVRVAGSLSATGDDETEALELDFNVTTMHNGCGVSGETMDFVLTSELTTVFNLETSGAGDLSWTGDVGGSVDWSGDDRSGSCSVDYSFNGEIVAESSLAVSLIGSVCGTSITREFSIGVG